MKKKYLVAIIFIFFYNIFSLKNLFSQTLADGCFTHEISDKKLKKLPWYANNEFLTQILEKNNYKPDSQQIFYRIPITLWVFSQNTNDLVYKKLIQDVNYFNALNNTGLEFYYAQIIPKYKTSPFRIGYTIPAFLKGFIYRKKGTVNILLVDDLVKRRIFKPTKYYKGQYNSASQNIVLRLNSSNTSMSHEIGHFFGLHHPHRGWKRSKKYQESVSRERKANRLFKNAKNCEVNGDAICDTPAEPVLIKQVDKDCNYIGNLKDQWGDLYVPNTHNIMSYPTHINCRNEFTEGQKAVMLYTAENKNIPHWKAVNTNFKFDKNEPNDTYSTAYEIVDNQTNSFNLHLKYLGKNRKIANNDVDWFVIKRKDQKENLKQTIEIQFENNDANTISIETNYFPKDTENKIVTPEQTTLISVDLTHSEFFYFCIKKIKNDNKATEYKIKLINN